MKTIKCPVCLGSGTYHQGDGGYNHFIPECGNCGGLGRIAWKEQRRDSTQGDTHTDPSDGNTGCARGQGCES